MTAYLIRRGLSSLATVLILLVCTFSIVRFLPGDVIDVITEGRYTKDSRQQLEQLKRWQKRVDYEICGVGDHHAQLELGITAALDAMVYQAAIHESGKNPPPDEDDPTSTRKTGSSRTGFALVAAPLSASDPATLKASSEESVSWCLPSTSVTRRSTIG